MGPKLEEVKHTQSRFVGWNSIPHPYRIRSSWSVQALRESSGYGVWLRFHLAHFNHRIKVLSYDFDNESLQRQTLTEVCLESLLAWEKKETDPISPVHRAIVIRRYSSLSILYCMVKGKSCLVNEEEHVIDQLDESRYRGAPLDAQWPHKPHPSIIFAV